MDFQKHVSMCIYFSGRSNVRYSIYSGDPDGLFRIDPITGAIKVSGNLDHESRASVLLNVQATSGNPPVYGHTQVLILLLLVKVFFMGHLIT